MIDESGREVNHMGGGWGRLREAMLELLYPTAANCLCCGEARRVSPVDCLCDRCRAELKRWLVPAAACNRCLSPVRQGQRCALCASPVMRCIHRVYAPFCYGGPVRRLIHAFKFDACNEALYTLCGAMAAALMDRDFDCIVPVPLHPRRQRERGANQALLLARGLAGETGIPVQELLERVSFHKPQSLLQGGQRRENVKNAFRCTGDATGLKILLLDDVRTSGSTADACARALTQAGAAQVDLCVCAVVFRRQKRRS